MLMKVGLYAGIFLATPVLLTGRSGASSRRVSTRASGSTPSPSCSSARWRSSSARRSATWSCSPPCSSSCSPAGTPRRSRPGWSERGRVEVEALRFARSGDFDRAANLADGEVQRLTAMGDGKRLGAGPVRRRHGGAAGAPRRRGPAAGRHPRRARAGRGARRSASRSRSGWRRWTPSSPARPGRPPRRWSSPPRLLAGAAGSQGSAVARLWKMQKTLAAGQARWHEEAWTRPLLTMSEQLSLVLMLLLALRGRLRAAAGDGAPRRAGAW